MIPRCDSLLIGHTFPKFWSVTRLTTDFHQKGKFALFQEFYSNPFHSKFINILTRQRKSEKNVMTGEYDVAFNLLIFPTFAAI